MFGKEGLASDGVGRGLDLPLVSVPSNEVILTSPMIGEATVAAAMPFQWYLTERA
jgi:hypothetical protein